MNKNQNNNQDLLTFSKPIVMGIVNLTPDSFYDGGKLNNEKKLLIHVEKLIKEGSDIIDIGAISSRPGSSIISEKNERERLMPKLKLIRKKFPAILISIDTFRAKIAQESIELGANMINDISAGDIDNKMLEIIALLKVPYVLMHMQGNPQTMQDSPKYNNVMSEVNLFFKKKLNILKKMGINNIILDPGFGFGKTLKNNYEILNKLHLLKEFNLPIMVGFSRKSMINNVLKTNPEKALNGTSILNTIALQKGATIIRVHDVKEAKEAIKIYTFAQNCI